ncbi:MAG: porin [Sulfurimonas sp.]|nr:porin [Sulfurimonas sp.]
MKNTKLSFVLVSILALSTSSFADDASDIVELKQQVKELQEMSQTLIDETSDLKTGFNYTTVDDSKSYSGLGVAASKVYYSKSPLSVGGYGEMYFNSKDYNNTTNSEVNIKRFITYFGYKFSDNIILNTEIEYEGGGVEQAGGDAGGGDKVVVEFLYLDFLINQHANIRLGNFLVPVGIISQRHEPTLFTTVQRPETSKYLIPTTWAESGVMVFGDITKDVSYKVAVITALQTTATGSKWLRNGRGGSFANKNPNLGVVARVDYAGLTGLVTGASVYYAPSANGKDSNTAMFEVHADYKNSGARVYGTYTQTNRTNSEDFNATKGVESAKGGYINASFDVLSLTSSEYSLPLFVQYESVNPQTKLVDGTSYDAVNTVTVGANFFPHEQVVLKLDYAMADNDYSNAGIDSSTISASLGFVF